MSVFSIAEPKLNIGVKYIHAASSSIPYELFFTMKQHPTTAFFGMILPRPRRYRLSRISGHPQWSSSPCMAVEVKVVLASSVRSLTTPRSPRMIPHLPRYRIDDLPGRGLAHPAPETRIPTRPHFRRLAADTASLGDPSAIAHEPLHVRPAEQRQPGNSSPGLGGSPGSHER